MDKLVLELQTRFDGINTNYLCSLSEQELLHLLSYLTQDEIGPTLFLYLVVAHTESMDADEKQYWLDIAPSLSIDQMTRIIDILCTEKRKLDRIDKVYSKEIRYMNLLLSMVGDENGTLRDGWESIANELHELIHDKDNKLVENWESIMVDLSNDLCPDGKLIDDWHSKIEEHKKVLISALETK